jgi:hypothetical protein
VRVRALEELAIAKLVAREAGEELEYAQFPSA